MQQDSQEPLQSQQPYYPPQAPPYYQPQQPPYTPPPQIYMPPSLTQKPMRWPWIIALIVVFFLGNIVGHATSSGSSTTDTKTSSDTTNNTNTAKSNTVANTDTTAHHKVGETVLVDDKWDITINNISTSQGDNITQPKVGNTFILITVTFKNTSSQQQAMSSLLSFTLRGPDGQNYNQSLFTGQSMPDGSVASGALTKGTLSYEVPTNVKTFTLDYADLGGQIQTWDITK